MLDPLRQSTAMELNDVFFKLFGQRALAGNRELALRAAKKYGKKTDQMGGKLVWAAR